MNEFGNFRESVASYFLWAMLTSIFQPVLQARPHEWVYDKLSSDCELWIDVIARVIRSSTYKNQLTAFAQEFKDHKDKLQTLLTESTGLTVTSINQKVDDISAKFDMVLDFINKRSPFEAHVMGKIEEVGGEEIAIQVRGRLIV